MPDNKFYINNTAIVNAMKSRYRELKSGEAECVNVSRKGALYTTFVLTADMDSSDCLLTPMDFLILDAAYSMYANARQKTLSFTLRELFNAMTGTTGKNLSASRASMLENELLKLARTRITIDFTDELISRAKRLSKAPDIPLSIVDKPLLSVTVETKTAGGRHEKKCTLSEKPPLYRYAEINNQVITVPYSRFMCRQRSDDAPDIADTRITDNAILINYWLTQTLIFRSFLMGRRKGDRQLPIVLRYYGSEGSAPDLAQWLGYDEQESFWRTPKGIHTLKYAHKVIEDQLAPMTGAGGISEYETVYRKGGKVPVGVSIKLS